MKLSLVLPAYNEGDALRPVLADFIRYGQAKRLEYELIVVDDGSTDATAAIIREFAASHPTVKLISHAMNQGYGAAVLAGFAAAKGDFVFFTDSDGQFQAADLDQTIPLLRAATAIFGYRQARVEGVHRRLNAWAWGRVMGLIIGGGVRDLGCAWKCFPRPWLAALPLVSRGAFINAELLHYARRDRLTVVEIPVHHFPRLAGAPTGAQPKVIWRAVQELLYFLRHRS